MSEESTCIFCRIIDRELPADVVHETATMLAFHDIAPQAPSHILLIPKLHVTNAVELAHAEPSTMAELFTVAGELAQSEGLGGGYRLVFNTGADAFQTVFHAHLHLIGGRAMTWPPG